MTLSSCQAFLDGRINVNCFVNAEYYNCEMVGENELDLALNLHKAGEISEAKRLYEEFLEHQPDNSVAIHYLGVAEFQTGNLRPAEKLILRSVKLSPEDPKARCNLGNVYRTQGRPAEAAEAYKKALSLSPDYQVIALNLGNVLIELNDFQTAASIVEAAA